MGAFLVSSTMHHSVEAVTAGNRAIGLWLRAGTWCAREDCMFEVPRLLPRTLGGTSGDAGRLVRVGLWEEASAGWSFVPHPHLWAFERRDHRERVPVWMRDAVLERDGDKCQHCGATEGLQMDHVFPWSRGGRTTVENLQALCGPCNRSKGASIHA